jgi:hypothetical protein
LASGHAAIDFFLRWFWSGLRQATHDFLGVARNFFIVPALDSPVFGAQFVPEINCIGARLRRGLLDHTNRFPLKSAHLHRSVTDSLR